MSFIDLLRRLWPKPAPKPAPAPAPKRKPRVPKPQPKPAPRPIPAPAPKPVPVPVPPPVLPQSVERTLLFIPSAWLLKAAQPASYWRGLGFTGLVVMADDSPATSLYNPAFSATALLDRVQRVREAAGDMELFLSHWCTNPYGPSKFLVAWDDEVGWERFAANLTAFSAAAVAVGAAGVLMDSEWYQATSTFQDPAIAWPASLRVEERARQYAAALRSAGPLTLGHYVTFGFERALPAYLPFWRTVERMAPGSMMLPEDGFLRLDMDYAGTRAAIKAAIGCESLGAVSLRAKGPDPVAGLAKAVPLARAGSPLGVWLYEWSPGAIGRADAALQAAIREALK